MPDIDGEGLSWTYGLAGRIGRAVAARRTQLLMTAAGLSERTARLGHPISPAAVAKIENNERSGRFEVAELLVLAAALDIPPILLLHPGFPDGQEEVLPGVQASGEAGARWVSGTDGLPGAVDDGSDGSLYATSSPQAGIALVEAVNEVRDLRIAEFTLRLEADGDSSEITEGRQRIDELQGHIDHDLTRLWGDRVDGP